MPNESGDAQKRPEPTQTETLAQRLKRLSQSDPGGKFFVDSSSVGPIVFHRLGSFEPKDDKGKE